MNHKLSDAQRIAFAEAMNAMSDLLKRDIDGTLELLKEPFPATRWVLAIQFSDEGGMGVIAGGDITTAAAEAELLERAVEFLDSLPVETYQP